MNAIQSFPIKSELRSLYSLASPILLSQLLQSSVMVVDTLMAGHYSANDLSGVAIGGSIWFPIALLLYGVISGLTPTIAQLHGAGKTEEISTQVWQSIWIVAVLAPCVMLTTFLIPDLLRFIQADPAVQPIAYHYLIAFAFGLPAFMLFNVLRSYSDGVSLTKPALWAASLCLFLNIPLNYIFIFGKFGAPELGGVGCGVASAMCFYAMFFLMLAITKFDSRYRTFHIYKKFILPKWEHLKNLLTLGIPIGAANFAEASTFGVIALFLASLGTVEVAAHQIALNFSALVFMIPYSIGLALTIRVGFLIGSNQIHRARFTAFFGMTLGVCYACMSAMIIYFSRTLIASAYTTNAMVIDLAATLLMFTALFQIGDAMQVTLAGALRGYKDTKMTMIIMFSVFWGIAIPLGYTLGLTDSLGNPQGAIGFWKSLVIGLFLVGALLFIRLLFISRRYSINRPIK